MKISGPIVVALIAVVVGITPVSAERAWDRYREDFEPLMKAGRIDQALSVAKDALKELEWEYGHEGTRVGVLLMNIGLAYLEQENGPEAEKTMQDCVSVLEGSLSPTHCMLIEARWWLSESFWLQKKHDAAITLLEAALPAAEEVPSRKTRNRSRGIGFEGKARADKILGPTGEWVIRLTERIAKGYLETSRPDAAIPYIKRYAQALEGHHSKDHPEAVEARLWLEEVLESADSKAEPISLVNP